MKLIIDITEGTYNMIKRTVFKEDLSVMFKQSAEDRTKTMQIFELLEAVRQGETYEKWREKEVDQIINHLVEDLL